MKACMKTGMVAAVVAVFFLAACAQQDEAPKPKAVAQKAEPAKKQAAPKPADAAPTDKVLATVGSDKITEEAVYAPLAMMPAQFRARYETPEGKKKLLERAVQMSLLSQEARKLKINEKPEIARRIKEMSDQLIVQDLTRQEVLDKISITDDDLKAYYDQNTDKFKKEEKVRVDLIKFAVAEGDSAKDAKKKKALAAKTLARIKKGEDFEKVAKEVSEDERTKNRGGNTGLFSRGKRASLYGEAFEEKAFSLDLNKVSDVFEAKDGLYIIKVVDKKPMEQEPFEAVKQRIERTMKTEKQKTAMEAYLEALKSKYPVTMAEEPAQGPAKAPAGGPDQMPVGEPAKEPVKK